MFSVQLMTHRVVANVVPDEDEPITSARDLARRQPGWITLSFVLVFTRNHDHEAHGKGDQVLDQGEVPSRW